MADQKKQAPPKGTGESISRRGEDVAKKKEPGRHDAGTKGATKRPVGKSTARDSTGINPQDPIDEKSPNLQSGN